MKSVLVGAAALALFTVSATACPFMKTAQHQTMSVASLEDEQLPMSTSSDVTTEDVAVDAVTTGAIETGEAESAE